MVYKQYQSPFDNQAAASRRKPGSVSQPPARHNGCCRCERRGSPLDFLGRMKADDIIILGIIIILLTEERENRDLPTIMALSFLFLIEYIER